MRIRWIIFGASLALLPSCGFFQQPCGCGESFDTDPFTGELEVVGPSHEVGVHCICQCGDDPEVLEPPSAQCEQYEGDCRTAAGVASHYTCE